MTRSSRLGASMCAASRVDRDHDAEVPDLAAMAGWRIRASVSRGRGRASSRTAPDIERINRGFGLKLRNGSLNLVGRQPIWLDPESAMFTSESDLFWSAWLGDVPVIINRWLGCPAHVYEIFAENHLRSRLGLSDGDQVEISGPCGMIDRKRTASLKHRLSWWLLWYRREQAYYHSNSYLKLIQKPTIRRRLVWRASQ
jgi:hypothetical protein